MFIHDHLMMSNGVAAGAGDGTGAPEQQAKKDLAGAVW